MRIGLLTSLWREGDPAIAEVCALRDQGLVEWVEWWLPRSVHPLPIASRDAVRAATRQVALPLSLHSEITTFFAHRDAAVRGHMAESLLDTLRLAQEIGATVVTIHPPLSLPAGAGLSSRAGWTAEERRLLAESTEDSDEAQGWFRERLHAAASAAEAFGLALALENMTPRAHDLGLDGAREVAAFVRATNRPGLRMCLDVRKARREGLSLEPLIRVESRVLATLHAAGVAEDGRPAAVSEGPMDWAAVFAALGEAAYAGPVIYEGPPAEAEMSLRALQRARGDWGDNR